MDLKRIFRGWVLAILLVVIVFLFVFRLAGSSPTYSQKNTSQVIELIENHQVKSAILTDSNQTIQITTRNGANLEADWVGNQGQELATLLQKQVAAHQIDNYNVVVPKGSSFWTLILGWLPFLAIFLLFFVFLNQMQGGGSRVMNFGKSKAKLITKDTPKTSFSDEIGRAHV